MPLFSRRPSRSPRLRRRNGAGGLSPPARQADWRAYDAVAADYARVHGPRTDLVARDLVVAAGVGEGARVLDVGTGTGVAARRAAERAGPEGVVGVDASLPMLEEALRAGGGPRYVVGRAIDLPFEDGTFDVLLASFVLAHFANHETALYEMVRVLTPGGRLAVTTWGPEEDEFSRAWQEVAEQFVSGEILRDARRQAMPGGDRFADRERLREALSAAGLREVRVERREYRFAMTAEEYLVGREISAAGRLLREILGEALWARFRQRARETFARRFPPQFNDFRDANLAVGTKPGGAAAPGPWSR